MIKYINVFQLADVLKIIYEKIINFQVFP